MPRFPKYPSCRYHPEKGNRVVQDQIEDEALTPASDGWVRNPSQFSAKTIEPVVPDPVTEDPAPEPKRRGKGGKAKAASVSTPQDGSPEEAA